MNMTANNKRKFVRIAVLTGAVIFLATLILTLNPWNFSAQRQCETKLEKAGFIYNFDKIILSVDYKPLSTEDSGELPPELARDKITQILESAIRDNFHRWIVGTWTEKPIVVLKNGYTRDGYDKLRDKNSLAIIVTIGYVPADARAPFPYAEEHVAISYYIYRKDWDDPAAVIPGFNNSAFYIFFSHGSKLTEDISHFLNSIKPKAFALTSYTPLPTGRCLID